MLIKILPERGFSLLGVEKIYNFGIKEGMKTWVEIL